MKVKKYCPLKGFAWKAASLLGILAVLGAGTFAINRLWEDYHGDRRTPTTRPTTQPTTMPIGPSPVKEWNPSPWEQKGTNGEEYRLTDRRNYGVSNQ